MPEHATRNLGQPAPLHDSFLGAFTFIFVLILLTGIYPLILLVFGNPEIGVILTGFFGLLLLATAFSSIGLLTSSFTSSFTENQIIAAVSCLVVLLLLYVIAWPANNAGETVAAILRYLSLTEHFGAMVGGEINTSGLIYFVSVIILALFLTQRSVESLRWR